MHAHLYTQMHTQCADTYYISCIQGDFPRHVVQQWEAHMYSYVLLVSNTSAHKEYKSQSKACFEMGRAVLEAQRVGERRGAGWGAGWRGEVPIDMQRPCRRLH